MTYTRREVHTKSTNIINGAPEASIPLKELGDVRGADANYSLMIVAELIR
jgi:hypothetical protein